MDRLLTIPALQLSVIATQVVPTTEGNPPRMADKIDLREATVLRELTQGEALVEAVLTDTAELAEGENYCTCILIFSDFSSDSEKQAAHGWGANEGQAELEDEKAGEAQAKAEEKEALTGDGDGIAEPAAEAEPEDNSISYADYLAQQAEKKLALGSGVPEARKPNEGSKQDKKWANAKAIAKEEEEDFVAGSGGKAKRERERKQKQTLEIDQRFVEQPDRGGRGGGGFRGGRGRGGGAPGRPPERRSAGARLGQSGEKHNDGTGSKSGSACERECTPERRGRASGT